MDMASGNFSASGLMGQTTTSNITTANAIGSNAINSLSGNKETISMTLSTSLDAMFKRKRGRPPKNRVVEVREFSYNTLIKKSKYLFCFIHKICCCRFLNLYFIFFHVHWKLQKNKWMLFGLFRITHIPQQLVIIVALNLCLHKIVATFKFGAAYNNPSIFHPRSGMKT